MNATKTAQAFTLIELLVTIAIIAVLASLLWPALAKAKGKANGITCLNGIKQKAGAALAYPEEHEDLLPREEAVDGPNSWDITTLESSADVWYNCLPKEMMYSRSVADYAVSAATQMDFYKDRILTCPSARFDPVTAQTYPNFSITLNSKLMNPGERVTLGRAEAQDTSRTVLFIDSGVPGEPKFCAGQSPYDGQPKAFASRFSVRHDGAGNVGFFDGHVERMLGNKVVETNPAKTNYFGRDISDPGSVMWWIK